MSRHNSTRISLYAFAILIFGYLFSYFGILSISIVYVVGFALALNGIGTFMYAYGANRPGSLFLSAFFFNSGMLLLISERFRLVVSYPFLASAFMLTAAVAFLLWFLEDTSKRGNLLYTLVFLIVGCVFLTLTRKFQPIDFLLWIKNIFSSFWLVLLALALIIVYSIVRDRLS